MIDEERKKLAKSNFDMYLREGLIKKSSNEVAKEMYL